MKKKKKKKCWNKYKLDNQGIIFINTSYYNIKLIFVNKKQTNKQTNKKKK